MSRFIDNYGILKNIDWDKFTAQKNAFETNNPEYSEIIKANVPKFTEVKAHQQYPIGKHGQGKLFHEHVWPKGFTPKRRDAINAVMPPMYSQTNVEKNPLWGSLSQQQEHAFIRETIARSTIDPDELDALKHTHGLEIHTGAKSGVAGEYYRKGDYYNSINDDSSAISLQNYKTNSDIYAGALTGQALIHELGHAVDDMNDPEEFSRNMDRKSWYKNTSIISPVLEGRAMGYQFAHFRATRKQLKYIKNPYDASIRGYLPKDFSDKLTDIVRKNIYAGEDRRVPAEDLFKSNRIKAFRVARGETPYPTKVPMIKKEPHYEQLQFPDTI